jgi:hypothetical protein
MPHDGEPLFGGWPAFYRFFFERFHWTLDQVNNCPIYLACILLGAISPDHTRLRMTWKDTLRYYAEDEETMGILRMIGICHNV